MLLLLFVILNEYRTRSVRYLVDKEATEKDFKLFADYCRLFYNGFFRKLHFGAE